MSVNAALHNKIFFKRLVNCFQEFDYYDLFR